LTTEGPATTTVIDATPRATAAPATAPVLDVAHLHVRFGTFRAVDDVSFSLRPGDLLGLIGPNGAGKTTLLRAVATLQPVTTGTVRLFGETLHPEALDLLRHVGFTPDTPPVYEQLTVRQFLHFIAVGYNVDPDDAEERIDFWLEKVWLSEKANNKIKDLSRGMRQRIGIARTLLPNPSLILLDEPAAGLDPAGRVQFRQLLVSLREQGKALIVSSHILADMPEYCTHIGIMRHGQLLRFGTVAHITGHADDARRRYTVHLARAAGHVAQVLADLPGVTDVDVQHDQLTCRFGPTRDDAAQLLHHLVAHKIPVSSFTANAPDLEEAYLRTGMTQVE
jgi:ABC-2 type transport system ATP-binding protein